MSSPARTWRIAYRRQAKKAFRRMPREMVGRIRRAIAQLATNPRPPGAIKLAGQDEAYRIRVGGWRIVYAILEQEHLIFVLAIGPRGGVYEDLRDA